MRYWFYRLGAETGLRAGELRVLRVADLDCKKGRLVVPAAYSKRRREDVIDWLGQDTLYELAMFVLGMEPERPILRLCHPCTVTKVLRFDLGRAGIAYRTEAGLFDFHALRHTFVTLAVGACGNLRDAQHVARLSTPALLARYAHPDLPHIREAMRGMPTF